MNEDKILKLLKSTNEGDVLIGLSLLAKLEDPRAFIRLHGEKLTGTDTDPRYDEKHGRRCKIITGNCMGDKNVYFKLAKDLYILFGPSYRDLTECYEAYSDTIPVLNN